jgi:hypothetical protein
MGWLLLLSLGGPYFGTSFVLFERLMMLIGDRWDITSFRTVTLRNEEDYSVTVRSNEVHSEILS